MPKYPGSRLRVSVAMPVRNAAAWLEESLASVLGQSEADFELIAVDDGSSDASRAILENAAHRDARLRVFETAAGERGIVAALNLALARAEAPLLARMDADDRMHPERLALQAARLDAEPSLFGVSSRAVAFPDEELRDGMRAYVDWQNSLLSCEEVERDRFVESTLLHPSVMLRTPLVREKLGGWQERGWPEDWDFFLRAFEAGLRIERLPETLLEWRQHAAQLTRSDARYSSDALLALRAHHLARHLLPVTRANRRIFVLGAGPVGKALAKALAREGLVADGIVDVDPRKIGGVVRGAGQRWKVFAHESLRAMSPRPYAVSAVSGAAARMRIRTELARWQWREEQDFVVAA